MSANLICVDKWNFMMDRVHFLTTPSSGCTFLPASSLTKRKSSTTLLLLILVLVSALMLVACGPSSAGANSNERSIEVAMRIAQEFEIDQNLAKAQSTLNEIDVANPRQWLMLQTETLIAENADPAVTASMVKLTEALNIQSNMIRNYALQQGLVAPTPTFVLEDVAVMVMPQPDVSAQADSAIASSSVDVFSTETTTETEAASSSAALLALPTPALEPTTPAIPQGRSTGLVNVRSGPGTTFTTVASLNQDDVVNLIGKTAAGDWWQVRTASGASGWVFAQLLEPSGDVSSVAVAANIPTPPTAPPAPVAAAEPAPTQAPVAEAPPAPVADGPDFHLVEKRLWDVHENGGRREGPSVICGEKRELHVYVRDAAGNPLNGVQVQALLGAREILVTGAQGKGDGKVEFVLGGGQDVTVVRDADGREVTADVAYGLTTDPRGIPFEQFIAGQYCDNVEACDLWANPTNQPPPCWGHYSWTVVFQRKY
jgi:uncharacterized protein YraI